MISQVTPFNAPLESEKPRPWIIVSEHPDHIGNRQAESIVAVEIGRLPSEAFAVARKRSGVVREHESRGRVFCARASSDKIVSTGWLEPKPDVYERTWLAVGSEGEELRVTAVVLHYEEWENERYNYRAGSGWSVELDEPYWTDLDAHGLPDEGEAFEWADKVGPRAMAIALEESANNYPDTKEA